MKARGQKYLNPSHGDNRERIIENISEAKIPKVSSSNQIIGASNPQTRVMGNNPSRQTLTRP